MGSPWRRRLRDPLGRAMFAVGSWMMNFGGDLCEAAGAWDSDTDHPPHHEEIHG